jgi:hypothetical protein
MERYTIAAIALGAIAVGIAVNNGQRSTPVPVSEALKCIAVSSSGSFSCKDAGNYDSTCATANCPVGYTLTGGGGACAAGDRKIKSLFPRFAAGEFGIACEQQGVAPQVQAICCKLQ